MTTEVRIHNIIMNLYNKNIWEYVEIVGTEPKFMIHDKEGHSTIYIALHTKVWDSPQIFGLRIFIFSKISV